MTNDLEGTDMAPLLQNYSLALQTLFERVGADSEQVPALSKRIAGLNNALVAGGSDTIEKIIVAGMAYAFQVIKPVCSVCKT